MKRLKRLKRLVQGAAAAVAVLFLTFVQVAPAKAATPVVQVGQQAVGTFSWVTYVIEKFDLDEKHGFTMDVTTYANKNASRTALRAAEADIVVDDFIGAALMRKNDIPVKAIYPFSLATGGIVVPTDSSIDGIPDLKGERIGVSSLGDKSWLILRALAVSQYGFDPQEEAEALAAAPPLMGALLDRGELDAAIPYWHFVARMTGSGEYRELMPVTEMLGRMDMATDLPILVIVATDEAIEEKPESVTAFLAAMRDAWDHLAADPSLMEEIVDAGLYSVPDRSLIPSIWERWRNGVQVSWTEETIDGLVHLVKELVAVGGADVVGLSELDPNTFTTELNPE